MKSSECYVGHSRAMREIDKPWTIQVSYTANGDDGKPFRARSAIHVCAPDIPSAYAEAERASINGATLGAIIPGHHIGMF